MATAKTIPEARVNLERALQRRECSRRMHEEGLLGGNPLAVLGPADWDVKVARARLSTLEHERRVGHVLALRRAGFSPRDAVAAVAFAMLDADPHRRTP